MWGYVVFKTRKGAEEWLKKEGNPRDSHVVKVWVRGKMIPWKSHYARGWAVGSWKLWEKWRSAE